MSEAPAAHLHFRIEPTEQDWLAAHWLMLRYRWRLSLSVPYLAAGCFAFGLMSVARGALANGWSSERALHNLAWGAGCGALFLAAMIILMLVFMPRGARRRYAEAQKLSAGADVTISTEGVSYDMGYATIALAWDQLKCWYEDARILVMEVAARQSLLLPKSKLDPGVIDTVRAHLVAAHVKRGLP